MENNPTPKPPRRKGGFATMDPARLKEIAEKGGRAFAANAKTFNFSDPETAKRAAQKGGEVAAQRARERRNEG